MFSSHSPGTCYNGALWALCYSMQYLGIQSRFQTILVHTPIFLQFLENEYKILQFQIFESFVESAMPKLFDLLQFKNRRGQAVSSLINCSHDKKNFGCHLVLVVCFQSHADATKETLDADIQIRLLSMSKRLYVYVKQYETYSRRHSLDGLPHIIVGHKTKREPYVMRQMSNTLQTTSC